MADQWKNCSTIFRYYLYKLGCLQCDDRECLHHFVLACRIFTKYKITTGDILLADALIMQFYKGTERQYGGKKTTR